MAILRASSGMLRTQIARRPAAVATPLRSMQIRTQMDDLGGPGGQEKPPSRPGGPDVLKRNWPAIGGVALVLVATYAYLTGGGPKGKDKAQEELDAAKDRAQDLKRKGQEGLRKLEDTGVGDLSGRKPGGMGGFRSD